MEDLVEQLTRDNPAEVKTVLATVTLVLAVYQLALIAVGYGKVKLRALDARPAASAHRASGDTILVLLVLLGLACLAVYGWEDDYLLHGVAGAGLLGLLAFKVAVVRRGLGLSRALPLFGLSVFALLVLTWSTSAPNVL